MTLPPTLWGGLPVDIVAILHDSKATAAKDAAKKRRSPYRGNETGASPRFQGGTGDGREVSITVDT